MNTLVAACTSSSSSPLAAFSGLLYAYDNYNRYAGPYSSLPDRGPNNRTLTVPGGSANPQGFPRNWDENGNPVLGFDSVQLQYAYDGAADALTYAGLNQPGRYVAMRVQVLGGGPIVTNWGGSTSNENALQIDFDEANYQINVFVTTKPGIVAIAATTPLGSIKSGDVFTLLFRHNLDQSWSLEITREPRFPGDAQAVIPLSGSHAVVLDNTPASHPLQLCKSGGSATYANARIHSVAIGVVSAATTANFASYKLDVANSCNFSFLPFDADSPLLFPVDYFDATHWNDLGQAKVGAIAAQMEAAAVALNGLIGPVRVGVIGDSRLQGFGATMMGVTDARAVMQTLTTFSRLAVGPVNDGSGTPSALHFCRSGYITRTVPLSQLGHSQRTPQADSIQAFIGPGGLYNTTRGLTACLGVNEIVSSPNLAFYDAPDELVRIFEYVALQISQLLGLSVFFVLLNEPVTGSTLGGPAQHLLRARNRAYHAFVRYFRTFATVMMGNLNDTTYFP